MKWIDLVKATAKKNKGKPLSHSLKEASKIWKTMKGQKGKTGKKKRGGDVVAPAEVPAEIVKGGEVPKAMKMGGSRKRRSTKKCKK